MLLIVTLAWMVGCSAKTDAPATASPTTEPAPASDAPSSVAAVKALLGARHTEDLPTAETLAAHENAGAALRYLADNGETMGLRARALATMRHVPSDETSTFLVTKATTARHPTLRAAALRGLAGPSLSAEVQELATSSLRDPDPRIGLAAVEVLAPHPQGRATLQALAADPDATAAVRRAAEAVLDEVPPAD